MPDFNPQFDPLNHWSAKFRDQERGCWRRIAIHRVTVGSGYKQTRLGLPAADPDHHPPIRSLAQTVSFPFIFPSGGCPDNPGQSNPCLH